MAIEGVQELQGVFAELQQARRLEWPRLATIRSALLDEVTDLYVPTDASKEYVRLVEQSKWNILRLVVKAVAQNLQVVGFRPTGPSGRAPTIDNSPIWDRVWQPNRMDSRQGAVHRGALKYGASFLTVMPGDPAPVLKPWSPMRMTALYADPIDDQWPVYAMSVSDPWMLTGVMSAEVIRPSVQPQVVQIYDDVAVYTMTLDDNDWARAARGATVGEHGLGVCPVVRFLDEVDDDGLSLGKVQPLLPLQDQLNQTTYSLRMAEHYAAFRQRWATGMTIELDDEGKPKAPWVAAVNRVWQNESPDGKFGDFAETNLSGYLDSRDKTTLMASTTSQVPPHQMLIGNSISNISAESLAALEAAHRHDIGDHQTSFGESWEQALRLAGRADGDEATWEDTSAQVVWADKTPRSLAQVVDALGKMATMLGVPQQALWERVPGATDQDIERWKEMAAQAGVMDDLRAMLDEESSASSGMAPADVKAAADAMGVLIRSGVSSESAARMVGLDGVEFTGAVPVSLRLPERDADELESA